MQGVVWRGRNMTPPELLGAHAACGRFDVDTTKVVNCFGRYTIINIPML